MKTKDEKVRLFFSGYFYVEKMHRITIGRFTRILVTDISKTFNEFNRLTFKHSERRKIVIGLIKIYEIARERQGLVRWKVGLANLVKLRCACLMIRHRVCKVLMKSFHSLAVKSGCKLEIKSQATKSMTDSISSFTHPN